MKKLIIPQILRALTAVVLALLLMFSTMATGFAAVAQDIAQTGATVTFTGTEKLFFNMNAVNWWIQDSGNGNFAYFYNDFTNKNAWSAHSVQQSGNYYYVVVPAGSWECVILTRNSVSTGPSWDNKYNQTNGIALDSSKNYISAFSENSSTATWDYYTPASTAEIKVGGQKSASVTVNDSITVASSLTSNQEYNEIKSHSYHVEKDGTDVTASTINTSTGVFSASSAGSYLVTDTVTYNAKGFTGATGTATISISDAVRINVVEAPASGWAVKKGMTIYLDDRNSLGAPKYYFAKSSAGANATAAINGSTISGLSNIYFAEAPDDGYTHVKVTNAGGTVDSGWCPITSAATNTLTYSGGHFYGLQLPWNDGSSNFTGGFGHVYFDISSTGWTISGSNKLYFVLGRDNYQDMIEMSVVANTNGKLYYLAPNSSWDNYTYFGFAVATSDKTGSYHPNTATDGVLKHASAYTTFASMYNLSGAAKSFIGVGLNNGTVSALDILWIRDTAIDGTGVHNSSLDDGAPANEGKYLNRRQIVSATAGGSATISYYKATSAGTSGVAAQSGSVSASGSSDIYPVRSSTVTIHPTPAEGYDVTSVVHSSLGTLSANGSGDYTYTVPGGTDKSADLTSQTVTVTFTRNSSPVVESLVTDPAAAGTTGVIIGDSVTLTATNTNFSGSISYTVTKDGTTVTPATYLSAASQTAAATNTNTFRSLEAGTYVVTATMGSSSKRATIIVYEPPTVMLLGLWTSETAGTAWQANTTNNPDRVMQYEPNTLTVGSDTYTGVYWIDLTLPGNSYGFWHGQSNGFKVYDEGGTDDKMYGNYGEIRGTTLNWTFGTQGAERAACSLETISLPGNHVYRFVYDQDTHKVSVYFPQVVTYNSNQSKYGGTDTTQQLAVTYGAKAKNITPTFTGYSFEGWYTTAVTANQTNATKVDFNAAVTEAKTVYAKWSVNNATVKIVKTENDSTSVINATSSVFSGISALSVSKPAASSDDYEFRGWVLSNTTNEDYASHVRLYTNAACTTAYAAGSDAATIYVKTDGEAGIDSTKVTLTAKYQTKNVVKVEGEEALSYFTGINGSVANPQDVYYGSAVNVTFNNLSAGFGIKSVSFDEGEDVEYINYGHYITFTMPDHDVHITDVVAEPFTCQITVKNSDKVDVDGIAGSGYYSTGADVHTITIAGSDDYHGSSTLTSLTVKYIGGSTVTVNASNVSETLTFDGHELIIVFDDATDSVTITGHIGGNIIITPVCETSYNVNITSKVMSDVGSKYVTYNKKETTASGEVESVVIATLKAFIKLTAAPADEDAADEKGVKWPLATRTESGDTYYLIAADEDGDYIGKFPEDSELLLVTEGLNNKYQFIGWFPGSSTGPELNDALNTGLVYKYTLNSSAFLYGVATRDIFLGGDGAEGNKGLGASISWSSAAQMTYDAQNKVYYYETSSLTVGTHYYFKIYDLAATGNSNSSGTGNQAVWYNAAKSINYNDTYGNITIHTQHTLNDNGQCEFSLTSATNTDNRKVRIYYKPSSTEVYIIPVYITDESGNNDYHELYLSNGRIDGFTKSDSGFTLTLTAPTQQITTPAQDGTGTTLEATSENYSYKRFTGNLASASFQVTINGSDASKVEVAGFVVYNMDTGAASTATATKSGNVYTGSVTNVRANTFICPVYHLTESYCDTNSITAYEVFVNAADVDTNVWGDLVAMYLFGGTGQNRDNNGAWPGQLMLPSGKTFTGVMYQKSGKELGGVLFNNYNVSSSFFGKFAKRFSYPDWAQTYDYAEPVTLMGQASEDDKMVLSFSLKQNNDGYRGLYYNTSNNEKRKGPYQLDVYNAENNECVPGKAYTYHDEGLDEDQTLFDTYTFEYLTDKDGKNRLNMYGESVGSAPAGYYVICVGDTDYKGDTTPNGKIYTPNTSYNGEYSVEWYIYDANGVFLLHTLSDALYARTAGSEKPYVVELLTNSGLVSDVSALSEKSVKISYEAPNLRIDATRFSGQWYANSTKEKVTVYAGVGMIDNNGKEIVPENPQSNTSYGSAAISYTSGITGAAKGTINGFNWASLKISDASTKGVVTLTASKPDTSTFKGWYSYSEATDKYTKVTDDMTFSPVFSSDSRYFAMFQAQATYQFTYPSRLGGYKTYSVKADTTASGPEMTDGGRLNIANRLSEINTAAAALNNLAMFSHTYNFSITAARCDNSDPYTITIDGSSLDTAYTLTVYAYKTDGSLAQMGSMSGNYSTECDVTDLKAAKIASGTITAADWGASGQPVTTNKSGVFLGWYEYDGSDFVNDVRLSTRPNYGYGLTKNLTIAPKYGTQSDLDALATNTWSAAVDYNEITQELTDANTGKLYNDTLIRFRYSSDSARMISADGYSNYGIIVMAQAAGATAAQQSAFNALKTETDSDFANKVQKYCDYVVTNGNAKLKASKFGTAYALVEKPGTISALNRVNICQILDYAQFSGGNYMVMAYMKNGSGYVFSNIVSGTYTKGVKFPTV